MSMTGQSLIILRLFLLEYVFYYANILSLFTSRTFVLIFFSRVQQVMHGAEYISKSSVKSSRESMSDKYARQITGIALYNYLALGKTSEKMIRKKLCKII